MDESDVERAKDFWSQVDVDRAFDELLRFLVSLRDNIKNKTASDKGYIQARNIILEAGVTLRAALKIVAIEEVLISEDILTVSVSDSHCTLLKMKDGPVPEDVLHEDSSGSSRNPESVSDNSQMSLSNRNDAMLSGKFDQYDHVVLLSPSRLSPEDQLAPMSPIQISYQQHDCSAACLPRLPPSVNHFLGHNPLRVPLLCHFQRHCAKLRSFAEQEAEPQGEEPDSVEADVLYKAPCGRGLCCMDDVLQFLQQTKSLGILLPVNFSFNPQVLPDRQAQPQLLGSTPSLPATILFERDISRGTEALPVPLCNEVDGVRPKEFRYRKDRWPHGCFLSAAPFFTACCDCTDGCTDSQSCTCLQLSLKAGADPGQLYVHQRLNEPVSTGLYECGPWCGCEKSRCLNRVVQRGLRVRLQVFRTHDKGWGVRCRDDLDRGTFVCTYAGVVLSLGRSLEEPLSSKNMKEEPVSDDEVEVVEEWTLPTGQKKTVTESLDTSPPLYIPVIQRPAGQLPVALDGEKQQLEQQEQQEEMNASSLCDSSKTETKSQDDKEEVVRKKPRLDGKDENGDTTLPDQTVPKGDVSKQGCQEQMYYLDASKEGNVARFINHSCNPNLFVQNVFVDTHDPKFPTIAFFTCRTITAGTELTWNYSYNPGSDPEHEVPCLCGYENCQAVLI
ncbi:histone-lysine N-methyltransferase SETDB2 isoform X1 [Colossoma macropomum]|uniref:histone-lysine N-methyltransferase SETDB2 isoform X1 n=2 Tax=Colossoma macropomum TaxID=42526 RepID=UPI00186486C7|nr:histone-lysine N-methyltransferase SETDB2 isoform X1 [Colossoma macropomum]